jgi:hypothetical protein
MKKTKKTKKIADRFNKVEQRASRPSSFCDNKRQISKATSLLFKRGKQFVLAISVETIQQNQQINKICNSNTNLFFSGEQLELVSKENLSTKICRFRWSEVAEDAQQRE